MLKFRGEDPLHILKLIRDIECNSALLPEHFPLDSRLHRAAYVHDATWLNLRNKSLHRITKKDFRSFMALLVKCRLRAAASKLWARNNIISETDIHATWIKVKNNVIVLYPDFGMACKIAKPNSIRDADSLYNEYMVLKSVEDCAGLNAPKPIAYNEQPAPALWMKYVEGRSVKKQERAIVAFRIAESMLNWYEYSGVETTRANRYMPLVQAVDKGVNGLEEKGWSAREAAVILNTLKTLSDSEMPLVVSQIHGDASTGNAMISNQDELIITDWENSRRDLVVYDLCKLINANPKIEPKYSDWLSKNLRIENVNPRNELKLAAVLSGIDLNRRHDYFSRVVGYKKEDVRARIQAVRQTVLNACEMLTN